MCIGPFKRACHWGPLVALTIIKCVTLATVACLSQWWPPWSTTGGTIVFFCFMSSAIATLYFFMQAMFTGPGVLPMGWIPKNENDSTYLQYCNICEGFKAPRSHHCRKCGTCNKKMDHHCPWINNCVGHENHTSFTMFLFFAVVGCGQATVVLAAAIYRAVNRIYYLYYGTSDVPIVHMSLWGLVCNMFVLGLAIGVVIAVGMLLFFQLRSIIRNRTGVEDWIMEKAVYRRGASSGNPFVYPYDLGRWKNFCQVINFSLEPKGDGVFWPVKKGCTQYTLTLEQLTQKAEKRARARRYLIVAEYSGRWLPITKGLCVFLHPPCTDEPRIKLNSGDHVRVTRWKKYWLYGELISGETCACKNLKARHRGWFPRRCAVEALRPDCDDDDDLSPLPPDPNPQINTSEAKKAR